MLWVVAFPCEQVPIPFDEVDRCAYDGHQAKQAGESDHDDGSGCPVLRSGEAIHFEAREEACVVRFNEQRLHVIPSACFRHAKTP